MNEAARILGVETEYAIVGRGDDLEHLELVEGIMRHARGPETVATRLDWAVKLGLFRAHARRRGVAWETLTAWSPVVAQLGTALARAGRPGSLTSRLVLGPASPLAAEVARLGPIVAGMGRSWKELEAVLALRLELFELDARFGQLDAAGALDHRVEPAPDPAPIPRAALRATLVRELAGNGTRYSCTWAGVWDAATGRYVDLGDPFRVRNAWQPWRPSASSVAAGGAPSTRSRSTTGRSSSASATSCRRPSTRSAARSSSRTRRCPPTRRSVRTGGTTWHSCSCAPRSSTTRAP